MPLRTSTVPHSHKPFNHIGQATCHCKEQDGMRDWTPPIALKPAARCIACAATARRTSTQHSARHPGALKATVRCSFCVPDAWRMIGEPVVTCSPMSSFNNRIQDPDQDGEFSPLGVYWPTTIEKSDEYHNFTVDKIKFTTRLDTQVAQERLSRVVQRARQLGLFTPPGELSSSATKTIDWQDAMTVATVFKRSKKPLGHDHCLFQGEGTVAFFTARPNSNRCGREPNL